MKYIKLFESDKNYELVSYGRWNYLMENCVIFNGDNIDKLNRLINNNWKIQIHHNVDSVNSRTWIGVSLPAPPASPAAKSYNVIPLIILTPSNITTKHTLDIWIYECRDEWFLVDINTLNSSRYVCDQFEGLVEFLKFRNVI